MSIKKYEAFVKIVEVGSLTRAAEELGYTQSGVSHMISALEEDFGFVLLRRSRAGVQLTEEGRRFRSDFIRIAQDTNRQMEQGFSPEELAALHRYLERVAQNLAAQTEETEL